ncbi:MAG: hypothetical protein L3K24_15425 [Gammaproteobacteria bacterium]|nr:hypothetical protein [Gammaproteobacteria bacterium]
MMCIKSTEPLNVFKALSQSDGAFEPLKLGRLRPRFLYEEGVSVGVSHDTAEFAVAAIERRWALQQFSNKTGLKIELCHYPPGTSKWNKIEHRLFCHITRNWQGVPLERSRDCR